MRNPANSRHFFEVFYKGILSGLLLLVFLLLLDYNRPVNKHQYVSWFATFVKKTSVEASGFSPIDWKRADRFFRRYVIKYHSRFASQLTSSEEEMIRSCKRTYLYYRTKSYTEEVLQKTPDVVLSREKVLQF